MLIELIGILCFYLVRWTEFFLIIHVNHTPILKLEAQKNTRPGKGTSALSSWFHPNLVMKPSLFGQPPDTGNIITLIGIR
ncbi:hypothetical protein D3C73_1605700 [compost metagenome]